MLSQVLANYFRSLDEADLRRSVRYARGRAFSSTDERVLSVGGAIVSDVIFSILDVDANEFWKLVVKNGEVGEALGKIVRAKQSSCQLSTYFVGRMAFYRLRQELRGMLE